MANTLKMMQNYDNPYEAAFNLVKGNPWFNNKDWHVMAKQGKLDDYLTLMDQTDKLPKIDVFNEEYHPEVLDTSRRFTAMVNELYGDRENAKERTEVRYDPAQNANVEVKLGNMSDYQYTKYLINQYKDLQLEQIRIKQEQERKDDNNFFQKVGSSLLSVPSEIAIGTMDFVDNTVNIFEGITDGLNYIGQGKKFTDGFRNAYVEGDWRIFENAAWQKQLIDWETKYSPVRDVEGNYTNFGRFLGGVSYSLGQAVPSMLINVLGPGLGEISTALYYTGMGSGTFKDYVNDPRMVSVPTLQILTNAAVKTTFEYVIQQGMTKAFGPSQFDKLVFGQSTVKAAGEATFKSAMKRITIDFVQEGLEELGQQFSSYLWDQTYGLAVNKNFGQMSDWNIQTAIDAFILGGLSTVGLSALSVITTKRIDIGKDKKLGKFASFVYNTDLNTMKTEYAKVMNDPDLTTTQKLDAVGQMYASFRTIASVYGEIGQKRFEAATKMLEDMRKVEKEGKLTEEQVRTNAETIFKSAYSMELTALVNKVTPEKKTKIIDELVEAGMKKPKVIVKRNEDESTINLDLAPEQKQKAMDVINELFKSDEKVKTIVLTEDGNTVVDTEEAIFVPIPYVLNANAKMILDTDGEKTLVINIMKEPSLQGTLEHVKKVFERVTNRTDVHMSEVIYNLFFNTSFYKILLQVSNADTLKILSSLEGIADKATTTVKDAMFRKKVRDVMKIMKISLTNYLIFQQNATYEHLSMLSNEQKDFITTKRSQYNLANRVRNGSKLTTDDLTLLKGRVNAMPASADIKESVMNDLKGDDLKARINAMMILEYYYKNLFNSPYDGKTYLKNDTIPNVLFNEFIKSQGRTIETLLNDITDQKIIDTLTKEYGVINKDTILQYQQTQFNRYTNGKYNFLYADGYVSVVEARVERERGYTGFNKNTKNIYTGKDIETKSLVMTRRDTKGLFNNVVGNKVSTIQRAYLNISDLIFAPTLLTEKLQGAIIQRYGALTPQNTFLYLRQYYLEKNKTVSISILEDGTFAFVDVLPMLAVLKNKDGISGTIVGKLPTGEDGFMINDVIRAQYLQGRLKYTKVVMGTDSYYDVQNNTIVIDKNSTQDPAYFRFSLLHEFQHAIQVENKLNGGINAGWLSMSNLNDKQRNEMLNDFKAHKPELFTDTKTKEQQLEVVNKFVYDTSGESQAFGTYSNTEVTDFYPTLVTFNGRTTNIVTPWGTKYELLANISKDASLMYYETNILDEEQYQEFADALYDMEANRAKDVIKHINYYSKANQIHRELGEITDKWTRLGEINADKPSIKYTKEKHALEVKNKQAVVNKITPQIRNKMLEGLRLRLLPTVPMDQFLNMDIPYIRLQLLKDVGNDPFVSVMFGNFGASSSILSMFYKEPFRYILVGTLKPKELLGAIPSAEREGMVKPEQLKDAKIYVGEYNFNDKLESELINIKSLDETEVLNNIIQKQSMPRRTAKQIGIPRYISNKNAINTNLEYFVKKNIQLQMHPDTKQFVINADPEQLEPELWSQIGGDKKGTLTKQSVYDYVRKADNINDYTFKLINNSFFKNDYIKSFSELQKLTQEDLAKYYAVRGVLRGLGEPAEEYLNKPITFKKFTNLVNKISVMPELSKTYNRILSNYDTFKGDFIEINYENARIGFMTYFDGTIHSAGYVGAIAKMLAINAWDIPGQIKKGGSMDDSVGDDMSRHEVIADITSQDALNNMLIGVDRIEKENELIELEYAKLAVKIKAMDKMPSKREVMAMASDIRDEIQNYADDDLDQIYLKAKLAEIANKTPSLDELEKSAPVLRSEQNISKNIRNLASRVKNLLTTNSVLKKDITQVAEINKDLFNEDLSLKQAMLESKTREELTEIENRLRLISKDVRAGVYHNKKTADLQKQLKLAQERLEREKYKNFKRGKKFKEKTFVFNSVEITVDTITEIPQVLKKILSVSFDKMYKTEVKFFTEENEVHMQMVLNTFFEENASILMGLNQTDVDEIIKFYLNSLPQGNQIKYDAFKIYMLSYFIEKNGLNNWVLTNDQITSIETHLKNMVSGAATNLAVWRSVLKKIDPNKVMVQSLVKAIGIEFQDGDIEPITKAIRSGNVKQIEDAMNELYEKGLRLYNGTKKSFWNKAWRLQRLFMLSAPGTAIRNVTSNTLIKIGNDAAELIGNLFVKVPGKYKKTGTNRQYKLVGTKVSTEIQQFIKTAVIDSDLLSLIGDGLNKYDVRKSQKQTSSEIMADLIVKSIVNRIFNINQFNSKILQNMSKFIYKMLSDNAFVNKAALSYFGKMLQEDDFNIEDGLGTQAMNTLAEAYVLAARDYMHKQTFFTKMEQDIRTSLGEAAYFVYKQLLPFASSSWNWFIEGLMYTPIGLIKGIVDFSKLENTIHKIDEARMRGEQISSSRFAEYLAKRNIGKGIIGTIGIGIGLLLGGFGVAKLDEEDDKIKLKIGDVYVDVTELFGTQSIMIGIALTNPTKGDWKNLFANVLDNMFNDNAVSDLFNTFRYSDTFGDWLLNQPSRMLGTMIPNFVKSVAKVASIYKVQYSPGILGQFERIATYIPGVAYAYPTKIDPYTGEKQQKYNIPVLLEAINSLSPVKIASYNVSEVEKRAIEVGVKKDNLTGRYRDIGYFNAEEINKLNVKYGELNKIALELFYSNKTKLKVQMENGTYKELNYKSMTDEQIKNAIEQIMSDNARYAKIFVYTSVKGGTYYATDSEYQVLRKLGIPGIYKETTKKQGFN